MPCMRGREYPWKLEHWWTKLAVIGLAWTSRHSSGTGSSERMNQEIRRWEDRKFGDWEVLHNLCLMSSKLKKYSSLCTRKASVPGKKTLTHFMSHHHLRPDLAKSAREKDTELSYLCLFIKASEKALDQPGSQHKAMLPSCEFLTTWGSTNHKVYCHCYWLHTKINNNFLLLKIPLTLAAGYKGEKSS